MPSVRFCQYATTKWRSRTKELIFNGDISEYDTCEEYREVLGRSYKEGN